VPAKVLHGGHPTIDTFLIWPRFWKKVAQRGWIIEDALYLMPACRSANYLPDKKDWFGLFPTG